MSAPLTTSQVVSGLEAARAQVDTIAERAEALQKDINDLLRHRDIANEQIREAMEAARVSSVNALGEAQGMLAFNLVFGSFRGPAGELSGQAEEYSRAAPEQFIMYDVVIREVHRAEAYQIIDAARDNPHHNPYATDRGKNAWRRLLFAAVLNKGREADAETSPTAAPVKTEKPVDTSFKMSEPTTIIPAEHGSGVPPKPVLRPLPRFLRDKRNDSDA